MSRPLQDCVVLFGDSITQMSSAGSFAQRMAEFYVRRLDIVNRGYGGYNSDWAKVVFPEIFAKAGQAQGCPAVRLVTIWFGANDACISPKDQCCPLPCFIENFNHFLESLTSPDLGFATANQPEALNIVLITPPPIVPSIMPPHHSAVRTWSNTEAYKDAVIDIAQSWKAKEASAGFRIGLINAWDEIIQAAGGQGRELEPFFSDGLHLNAAGYQIVFDAFKRLLVTDFKGRGLDPEDPEDLPFRVPWFQIFDKADYKKSLLDNMKLPKCRSTRD